MFALYLMFRDARKEAAVVVSLAFVGSYILLSLSTIVSCHSLNWSGWRVLALVVPVAGLILVLLLLFLPRPLSSDTNSIGISS